MFNDFGRLTVRAQTGGAYPVSGAIVRIRGADEEISDVNYSLITNLSGNTETITLPAPSIAYSASPNAKEIPFASYDIEITAQDYYPKRIYGVEIFPRTDSIQIVSMIPIEGSGYGAPTGELVAEIPNQELED